MMAATRQSSSSDLLFFLIIGLVLCLYLIWKATKGRRFSSGVVRRTASSNRATLTKAGQAALAVGTVVLGIALFAVGSVLKNHFALQCGGLQHLR